MAGYLLRLATGISRILKTKLTGVSNNTTMPNTAASSTKISHMVDNVGQIDISQYDELVEGSARMLFPKNRVFYNPVQQYNRDLSCLAIKAFTEIYQEEALAKKQKKRNKQPTGDGKTTEDIALVDNSDEEWAKQPFAEIMEALSASGLRAIRYSKEIPLVKHVIANDLSPAAVESIKVNVKHNGLEAKVTANHADAIKYMSQHTNEYHVIDLDPYGSAAPFMDSAMQSIKDGGLMLVTCTDLGVLAGNGYPEKCFALYGGSNVGGDSTHEGAIRLALHMISSTAAKYKKSIEPLLCLSIDFYIRMFIRVHNSPIQVKNLASSTMLTYKCSQCHSTATQPLGRISLNKKGNRRFGLAAGPTVGPNCAFCGAVNHIGGPMWGGPLHNGQFIDRVLQLQKNADPEIYKTLPRIEGMLTMAKREIPAPFYFKTNTIASILKIPAPSIETYTSALANLGYTASLTHASSNSIKTDAPWEVIWFIGKKLAQHNQKDVSKLSSTTAGYKILTNESIGQSIDLNALKTEAGHPEMDDFDWLVHANDLSRELTKFRRIKILRFQENPTKYWGPKSRPK